MSKEDELKYLEFMSEKIRENEKVNLSVAIQGIGTMIDESINLKNLEGLQMSINLSEMFLKSNVDDLEKKLLSTLHYYIGVAYSELHVFDKNENVICIEKTLFHYRMSIEVLDSLSNEHSSTLVNLANVFSLVGREFDALRCINSALNLNPEHPIALGNKARILDGLARGIYDDGHKRILYAYIYKSYNKALRSELLPDYARFPYEKAYEKLLSNEEYFNKLFDLYENEPLEVEDSKNRSYRMWCLNNELFLNPLNGVMRNQTSARDVFLLPSIVTDVGDGPYFHSMFNNIKQEFVSSRYLFYKGLDRDTPHFSDEDVTIYNTLDYASQSYNNECVKAGFRVSYSLLDKIAYFINIYFKFKLPYNRVSFRNVWTEKIDGEFVIRRKLRIDDNWAMKALVWLGKELHEKDVYEGDLSSFSRKVPELRNHIEHKHLKILDMDMDYRYFTEPEGYAMSIERSEFEDTVMFLIKLVRDAIMYLSIAINIEEYHRSVERGEGITPPMFIDCIEDDWKI